MTKLSLRTIGKCFRKKLFQQFIHRKKIFKATKFQFEIIRRSRVKYTPIVHCTPPPGDDRVKIFRHSDLGFWQANLNGLFLKRGIICDHFQSLSCKVLFTLREWSIYWYD